MNIDIIIVACFLVLNLIIGIYHGRGISTLKYYAIGDRNFSTATIAATIVATWIAGSSFSITASETYNRGLYFVIPGFGDVISFFIIAYFYAPRLLEFLGTLSVAEAMGQLYGNHVRFITAVSGIIPAIGNVAMQFTLLAALLSYSFGISGIYASIISSIIVIIYSSFGGIKSVTFTDVIQFSTFGIVLPIVAFVIWNSLSGTEASFHSLTQDPLFNCAKVFDYHNPDFINTLFLFLFFMIPALDPAIFQRISMAKNTRQVSRSFIIAGIIIFFCDPILNTFIGILLKISSTVELNATNVLGYVLDTYICSGFKGVFIIGIISMIMSTADSYINSSAILLAHDVCKSLNFKLTEPKELLVVRVCALFIGIIALLISLFFKNLLDLVLATYGFYMPIVSVPLILAIFGFRSTSKAVLLGMGAGFTVVIAFKIFSDIDGLMPGMIANLLVFIGSHYLLKQAGGWLGIKETTPLEVIKFERKRKYKYFIEAIKKFNLIKFFKDNSPKDEKIYVCFGLFCFVGAFSQAYSLNNDIYKEHPELLQFIYCTALTIATIFTTYPAWSARFKNKKVMAILWNAAIMFLIFVNSFIAIVSNLHQIQFAIFMATLMVISVLSRWMVAMFMIICGVTLSVQFYKLHMGFDFIANNVNSLQLQIVYALLLISCILIAFIKPRQQKEESSENVSDYLEQQSNLMQLDLIKLSQHREEFINRLDQQCINVFRSTYEQIIALENGLMHQQKTTILGIVNKLKIGAKYLNDVIWTIKNQVKIEPIITQIEQFIYDVVEDYTKMNINKDFQILINCKTNNKEIEIDQDLFKTTIITCIDHGLKNSDNANILITIEDARIEYNVESNDPLKIRRSAINISIIFDSTYIKQTDIDRLVNYSFNTINEINFANIYRIIVAHYGKIHIYLNEFGKLVYSIIVPIKLKEIRPKKNELPDYELEKFKKVNNFMANKTKELLLNIAKQLVQSNMNLELVAKITKLSIEEIEELEV